MIQKIQFNLNMNLNNILTIALMHIKANLYTASYNFGLTRPQNEKMQNLSKKKKNKIVKNF